MKKSEEQINSGRKYLMPVKRAKIRLTNNILPLFGHSHFYAHALAILN